MSNQPQLTHWKKLTNPDYIGAYELMQGEKTIDLDVTIGTIKRQEVVGADGKKSECTVAQLVGHKPFIINATNAKMITKLLDSPYIEQWAGKTITLYVAKVRIAGDWIEALRVRPKLPAPPAKPELTPTHEKWNGALQAVQSGTTTIEAIRKAYKLSAQNEALLTTKPTNTNDTSTPNT